MVQALAGRASQRLDQLRVALAQGDESDADLVELGEVLVGGELAVEHQQLGQLAVGALVEAAEVGHLARLLAAGELGVGVEDRVLLPVLSDERQHRAGPLRAAGNVVLLEHGVLLAVAHDRVKVEVHSLLADQPRLPEPGLQRLEERDLLRAAGAVGVGRQMPGLGQHVQSGEGAQRRVVHD